MTEAKKRNPNIKLYGLSWGAPGWIGQTATHNESNFYSADNIDYHLKWIQGARQYHNLTIDYLGVR